MVPRINYGSIFLITVLITQIKKDDNRYYEKPCKTELKPTQYH